MKTTQLKLEIQKVIETIPENVLQELLEYLKAIQNKAKEKVELSRHLRQILSEDKELLERLAQ